LMFVNFNVAIFNALPIGPLDGGQLYNSLIESKVSPKRNRLKNVAQLVTYVMIALVAVAVLSPWLIR
jgi:membrane-associated protease RseP (regulator of RpoE activity)